MRHEHEITQALKIDGVLKSEELVQCENGSALILENTGASPFKKADGLSSARAAGLAEGSAFTDRHPERSALAGHYS